MGDPLGLKDYLAMAKLVGILILLGLVCYQSSQIHKWHTQSDKQVAARATDRASYEAAQAQAQANNELQIQFIKRQQEAITNEVKTNLGARLDLIRRELSKGGTAAPQNTPGSPPAGISGPAPCRAYDPAWLCLSPSDRLLAAENEERHDELIDWVTGQSQIDPNR